MERGELVDVLGLDAPAQVGVPAERAEARARRIEQNAVEALRISDTCIVLAGGRVRACAPAGEVLGMKELNSLYLGDAQALDA